VRRRNLAAGLAGAWVLAGALVSGVACSKARTPEQAQARLCKAVAAGDPAALFEALDTQTRWDWMTVQKSHREAYDIILSNYPEGAERDRELRRFERGATLGSGRALFAEEMGRPARADARLRDACAPGAHLEPGPDARHAAIITASGTRAPLLLGPKETWGYSAFAEDAEDRRRRALADVDQIRLNAADYERAAARAAR
jgi:hypothetical protein